MGYRSQVALALKAKHIKSFLEKVVFHPDSKKLFDNWCQISTEFEDRDDENGILFHWHSIKWYETYDSVSNVMKFICDLPGDDPQADFYFLRIGEDLTDVELEGLWWVNPFEISLDRSIHFAADNKLDLKDLDELRNKRTIPNEDRYEEILKEI